MAYADYLACCGDNTLLARIKEEIEEGNTPHTYRARKYGTAYRQDTNWIVESKKYNNDDAQSDSDLGAEDTPVPAQSHKPRYPVYLPTVNIVSDDEGGMDGEHEAEDAYLNTRILPLWQRQRSMLAEDAYLNTRQHPGRAAQRYRSTPWPLARERIQ